MSITFRSTGFSDPLNGFDTTKIDVQQEPKKVNPENSEELDPHEEAFDIDELLKFDSENDPNNMLGKRWLVKGGTFVLAGDSGKGKSSLLMKLVVGWALNAGPLGIDQAQPLKTLIIQDENDFGDMAEMLQGVLVKLDESSRAIVKARVIIRRVSSMSGEIFATYLRKKIETIKPNVVIVDPFVSYFDGEMNG